MAKNRARTKGSVQSWKAPGRRRKSMLPWILGGAATVAVIILAVFAVRSAGGKGGDVVSADKVVGAQASDFSLPVVGGGQFSLDEYLGKKNVLLYFNEGYG